MGNIEVIPSAVTTDVLPELKRTSPTHDPHAVLSRVLNMSPDTLPESRPGSRLKSPNVWTMEDFGIDLEMLVSDARAQSGDRFRRIIRMGGAFEFHRNGHNDREVEEFAVNTMGLDASLFFHGLEQARRMDRLMTMQQIAHQKIVGDMLSIYKGDEATASIPYQAFRSVVPDFSGRDFKYGVLCGFLHDYGEAKLGKDVPFELKNNKAYVLYEAAAAVELARDIHFPHGDKRLVVLLDRRVRAEKDPSQALTPDENAEASLYLSPSEITTAIFGTEKMDRGEIVRGEAFAAVERVEYVLSGIRAFEAVEHNYNGVADDPILRQNLLRLGVSTFFNSLGQVAKHAERYVAVYDFLAQNQQTIDYYIDAVYEDIQTRYSNDGHNPNSIFPIDPFENYQDDQSDGDTIAIDLAKAKFLQTTAMWREWKHQDHVSRAVWEAYFGTEHRLTVDNPDVSFLQQTARRRRAIAGAQAGQVAVYRHLRDMHEVGLDRLSQEEQQSRFEITAFS